jgi:hypothetical protein
MIAVGVLKLTFASFADISGIAIHKPCGGTYTFHFHDFSSIYMRSTDWSFESATTIWIALAFHAVNPTQNTIGMKVVLTAIAWF